MKNETYNGVFISPDTVADIRDRLSDLGFDVDQRGYDAPAPHVTLEFRPNESMRDFFGESCSIVIKGYGVGTPEDSDSVGKCEGVLVSVITDNPELQSRFDNLENDRNCTSGRETEFHAHITLSYDRGEITAVETGYIEFEALSPEDYIRIDGAIFGGFYPDGVDTGDRELHTEIAEAKVKDEDMNPDKEPNPDEEPPDEYFGDGDSDI